MKIISDFKNMDDLWNSVQVGDILSFEFDNPYEVVKYIIIKKIKNKGQSIHFFTLAQKTSWDERQFRKAIFDEDDIDYIKIFKF